jgi:hypothetical protein
MEEVADLLHEIGPKEEALSVDLLRNARDAVDELASVEGFSLLLDHRPHLSVVLGLAACQIKGNPCFLRDFSRERGFPAGIGALENETRHYISFFFLNC